MNMLWIILMRLLLLLRCGSFSFIASILEFMIFFTNLGYHYMLKSCLRKSSLDYREITFIEIWVELDFLLVVMK